MKSSPLIVRRLVQGTKRSNIVGAVDPSQSLALYPQTDTEPRFSSKFRLNA